MFSDRLVGFNNNNTVGPMKRFCVLLSMLFSLAFLSNASAGTVTGSVKSSDENQPLVAASVAVMGTPRGAITDKNGSFRIANVKPGNYTMRVTAVGYMTEERLVEVSDSDTTKLVFALGLSTWNSNEVIVYAASRQPEKLTHAPAAISIIGPAQLERNEAHGSIGMSMQPLVGVDVAQSGANDFNINARGFNNSINRRMLVLIDGRDNSTPLINLNEWNSFSSALGDISSIEVVRGPGSALYGQNAYNGVVNMRTYAPSEVLGTRVSLGVGEWKTYRAAVRHAGQMNDLSYKFTLGASSQYNYSLTSRMIDTTKPNNGVEYLGLRNDVRALSDAHKRPFQVAATARFDYDLHNNDRIVLEGGYAASGNEMYVNQTGRLIVQRVEKPFARLAYNSERFNVQGIWNRRNTPDKQIVYNAMAASLETSDVYGVDAQYNNSLMDGKLKYVTGVMAEYQDINSPAYTDTIGVNSQGNPLTEGVGLTDPTHMIGRFLSGYAQAEYVASKMLSFIGAARIDASNVFNTQFSPKLAIVFQPESGHAFRLTYNRSFLRPAYTELYRKSPAGAPANLTRIGSVVDSVTSAITGQPVSANLNLGVTPQWNLGNVTLTPETANSIEFGYRGKPVKGLSVEFSGYWNRRTNLISSPLGGLAPGLYAPVKSNTGTAEFNAIADSVLRAELGKLNPNFSSMLATYNNGNALVIAPTNIAVVDELGAEVGATYFITDQFSLLANYAYIDVAVSDNTVPAQRILPNTSRHRINVGLDYLELGKYDASLNLKYVEGFNWIAGTQQGFVPAYAVLNFNAGVYVVPEVRVGINAFNLLDREHYQIFGGTILRRQVTGNVTYTF